MTKEKHDYLNKAVLIIDDDAFILKVAARILENMGFKAVTAALNASEAMQCLNSTLQPIGLIISDLNMPDVDGLELLRTFSEQGYEGDIILFSGEDEKTLRMAEKLARARQLSILGAIAKPLSAEKLQELLSRDATRKTAPPSVRSERKITPAMLKEAIAKHQIVPWFQPKIDVQSREAVGVEALARWFDSDIGPIFPDEFIPLAERHHLIDDLTDSIIRQVIPISRTWSEQNIHLNIAINVSMDSLSSSRLSERILSLIEKNKVDPASIQFEITESRLPDDMAEPLEILLRLRMNKINLSIDDFGTGHSNLNQLRELPFDELKLDRSYVVAGADDQRAHAILESSIELAKKLNMTVVAEGVETLEDWFRLEKMGCSQIQGYFAARPMPAEQIPEWYAEWPKQRQQLFRG